MHDETHRCGEVRYASSNLTCKFLVTGPKADSV